ncbi:MAG TPA: hypothetical protein VIL54_06535 [Natronosporangium sp.]
MVGSWGDSSPASRTAGLTGFRYLLAVLLLILLATVPMVLAVRAGLGTLAESPPPTPEPFLRPAEQDIRVLDGAAVPLPRGTAAYR